MSTDLEEALAECMRPHGEGAVDVAALRTTAVARGRSAKRLRTTVAVSGLAVLTAATLGIVPVLRGGDGASVAGPGGRILTLPPADAPGAAAAPQTVGTDPTVFHFDVDVTTLTANGAMWSTRDGVESVRMWSSEFDHFDYEYQLTRDKSKLEILPRAEPAEDQPADTQAVTVNGRPGTARFWPEIKSVNKVPDVPTWTVDWQPADGLFARLQLFTTDVGVAVAAAEQMLLDRSQRCVGPMRLVDPATPVTVVSCFVDFGHIFPWTVSEVMVETADGVRYRVGVGHYGLLDDQQFIPNQLVAGRPAMLTRYEGRTDRPNDVNVWVPITNGITLTVSGGYRDSEVTPVPTTDAEILAIAGAVRIGPNFSRPHTWPTVMG